MSFLASGIANAAGQGLGYASQSGLLSELEGAPTRVQFLRKGIGIIFAFDAVVNEQISREAQIAQFPVEDGSSISDSVQIMPPEITLTGLVSDTPIYADDRLFQTLGEAFQTIVPPLGIVVGAVAQKAYALQNKAAKRSKQAYTTLIKLQAGDPTATPPVLPEPFTLLTYNGRFENMLIKSLSFSRDSSTANTLVATLTLSQLRRVRPQAVNISIFKVPGLAASKQHLGEAEDGESIGDQTLAGEKLGYDVTQHPVDYIKKAAAALPGLGG